MLNFVEIKTRLEGVSEFLCFDKKALGQRAAAFAYWVLHGLLQDAAAGHHRAVRERTQLVLLVPRLWWQSSLVRMATHGKRGDRSGGAAMIFFALLHLLMLLLLRQADLMHAYLG